MNTGKHILVVDDDADIRDVVSTLLSSEGFRVTVAADGAGMRNVMVEDPADLTILDLVLPDEDGFALARHLREQHRCGIIILTGKSDSTDRIVGLEVGADDYVLKPFVPRELLARVRSVLRRVVEQEPAVAAADTNSHDHIIQFGSWQFDTSARRLTSGDGQLVELTTGEFNLLREFVDKPQRVLSREHLLGIVHNRNYDVYDRSIDVLVTRLRRKLEANRNRPELIKTVRGAGYIFTATVSRQ